MFNLDLSDIYVLRSFDAYGMSVYGLEFCTGKGRLEDGLLPCKKLLKVRKRINAKEQNDNE